MKFSDLIVENKKQELTEKPMGFLKTMGNKVASAFGSGKAQGRLDTGKKANALRKEFDVFLGKTGQNPTGDLVLQFLKQKGYPTKSAQNFIAAAKPQAATAKQEPAAQTGQEPAATKPQAQQEPAAQTQPAQAAQPSKDEIAKRVKANVGKSQAATKGSSFGQKPEPAKPDAGAGVMAQFVKQQTGDNPITMKPAPQKAPAAQEPQQAPAQPAEPAAQPAAQEKPGFLKTATDKIQDRAKNQEIDAIKAKPGFQRTATDKLKLKAAGVKESFDRRLAFYLLLEEVLSGKQLDQIFLAAAQEKAKGGAAQGDQPGAQLDQPAQEPAAVKKGSNFIKQAAAAYDGMRGAAFGATKIGQEEPGKALKDTSGRVPQNIMNQINQLTNKQRAQLRKELDKA